MFRLFSKCLIKINRMRTFFEIVIFLQSVCLSVRIIELIRKIDNSNQNKINIESNIKTDQKHFGKFSSLILTESRFIVAT